MPASYLLNTPPDDLAAHIGYVRTVRAGSPAIDMKDDRAGQFTLLTVVARDKQGLLSEIAGVVHAMNIDVHAAQIFTRHSPVDDIAIDILYIDLGPQLAEMKKWQLEAGLMGVLGGNIPMDDFLRQWGKKRLDRIDTSPFEFSTAFRTTKPSSKFAPPTCPESPPSTPARFPVRA